MAIVKPFVTREFTSYAGDVLTAKVLLALRLVDDFLRLEDANAIQQGRRSETLIEKILLETLTSKSKDPGRFPYLRTIVGFIASSCTKRILGKPTTVLTQW